MSSGHRPGRLARRKSTVSTASCAAARSPLPERICTRCTVVVRVMRFDTQTTTPDEPSSGSRTIANAATGDRSLPARSICAIRSTPGSSGRVTTWNSAAPNSPAMRTVALRVSSSSAGGDSTSTRPRQG